MNKELAKAIMTRSRLKNIFIEEKNKQNWQGFAKQKISVPNLGKKRLNFTLQSNRKWHDDKSMFLEDCYTVLEQ